MAIYETFSALANRAALELEARDAMSRAKQLQKFRTKGRKLKQEVGDPLESGFQLESEDPYSAGLGELTTDQWSPEDLVEMARPHAPLIMDWDEREGY
jgi:hypothetical protein